MREYLTKIVPNLGDIDCDVFCKLQHLIQTERVGGEEGKIDKHFIDLLRK